MENKYFEYDDKRIEYLSSKDKILGDFILKTGPIQRQINPDLYSALVDSIMGQQISTAAHNSIRNKAREKFGPWKPEVVEGLSEEDLRSVGLSSRKARYIKGITRAALSGELDPEKIKTLPDEEVIKKLVSLKGVGKWTAEMMLTFSLGRPDVLSYGDLGIRRGICRLYSLESLSEEKFHELTDKFSPYRSVAALYFWEAASVRFELKQ